MTLTLAHDRWRRRLFVFSPGFLVLLVIVFAFLPPDGLERASWLQFIGRFHLLTVHFPIALILLVPVLELAGRNPRLPHLRASVDFLWVLAMFSSLAAAALGWCLARSGGYAGRLLTQHMWGGFAVAGACWLCWTLRGVGLAYWLTLVVAVGLVSWTGYRGGQLSQGENHLTEQMPTPLRRLIGLSAMPVPRSNPAFFYGAQVEPVFVTHCYECHGPDKQKGRLRLDSYEALMHGGKHGPVIRAGDVKRSELFHRVTLPSSDDDAMPPQGKRPLAANEVKLLELWIAAGASPSLAADGIKDAPTSAAPLAAEVNFPEKDSVAVANARASFAAAVAQVKQRLPDVVDYESRGSANLVLDASAMGARFGDEDLAAVRPVAGLLVSVDLSRTAITDRSAPLLATMKRARVLRLTSTKVTDSTVEALGGLDQLESLDLYGTSVTPGCLKMLSGLPKLRHIYAGVTKIPQDVSAPPDLKSKLVY